MRYIMNQSYTYNYTGTCQKVTLEPGLYYFQCYGGKGGGTTGANGKYVSAYFLTGVNVDLYLYIGGQCTSQTGGWNGGQTVTQSGVYGGGGLTDIAFYGIEGSTSWNTTAHLNSRLLAAAGGQGQGVTGGDTTGSASSTYASGVTRYVNRSGVKVMEITPKTSGTIHFQSTSYSHDPYGFIDNAAGTNLASNDDGAGGPYNFLINYSASAGVKYILRIGSYASSLSTTGSCNWYASYPNSTVAIYATVVTGGSGGSNYFDTDIVFDTTSANSSYSGNGKIIITKKPNITRFNTNFYKDSVSQYYIDFNKLLELED